MKLFGGNKEKDKITGLTEDQKKANLAAGLNEDGSAKTVTIPEEQQKANLAAGLNADGSAKTVVTEEKNEFEAAGLNADGTIKEGEYQPSEFVIKEMMHQKGISREEAIKRLKNPQ